MSDLDIYPDLLDRYRDHRTAAARGHAEADRRPNDFRASVVVSAAARASTNESKFAAGHS